MKKQISSLAKAELLIRNSESMAMRQLAFDLECTRVRKSATSDEIQAALEVETLMRFEKQQLDLQVAALEASNT